MSNLVYYILDIETNGLSKELHEICEYSIIRCSDKTQLTRQIKVDKPLNSSTDALRITGKTIDDLKRGISKKASVDDFHTFVDQDGLTPSHRVLVGHNIINFDRRFLHYLWEQQNKSFPIWLFLDTMQLSKRMVTKMGQPKAKVKLEAVMDLFGLKKYGGLHTAKGDARNTYNLWKYLMDSNIEYLDLIKQMPHGKQEELTEEDIADFE